MGDMDSGAQLHDPNSHPRSPAYCAAIALAAGVFGSGIAALIFTGYETHDTLKAGRGLIGMLSGIFVMVWIVSATVSIPASLLLGTPLLWASQRLILRHPVIAVVLFALIGGAAAVAINHILLKNVFFSARSFGPYLAFGSVVAATNAILFHYNAKRSFRQTLLIIAITMVATYAVERSILDTVRNNTAEKAFAASCVKGHAVSVWKPMAVRADNRYFAENMNRRRRVLSVHRGKWHQPPEQATMRRYSAMPLAGGRALVVHDVAYAPYTLLAHLGFNRRVKRHCLSELKDPLADLARKAGLVDKPEHGKPLPLF